MPRNDDDDLFPDVTDEGEAGEEEEAPEEPEAPAGGEDLDQMDEGDMVRDLISELSDMGIVIPDSVTNCRSLCEHLHTALGTHKATKALAGGRGGSGNGRRGWWGGAAPRPGRGAHDDEPGAAFRSCHPCPGRAYREAGEAGALEDHQRAGALGNHQARSGAAVSPAAQGLA